MVLTQQDINTLEAQKKTAAGMQDGDKFTITGYRKFSNARFLYRRSLEGKHCIFIFYDKDHNFHSFVACDTLVDALWKINDLAMF